MQIQVREDLRVPRLVCEADVLEVNTGAAGRFQ